MSIVIRPGTVEDYPGFLEAEERAWEGKNVQLVTFEIYRSWLEVFPEGLVLAEHKGQICGHVFSQICRFDPYDETDNRTWDELTDYARIKTTHNPSGQTMYTVSVSASVSGAGKLLLRHAFAQARERNIRYYAGASSIPGISTYAQVTQRQIDRSLAEEYVAGVLRKLGKRSDEGPRIRDPVIGITLSIEGTKYVRLLEDYFDYPASGNWAVLIVYENPNWRP